MATNDDTRKQILDRLAKYGDSLLDEDAYKNGQKKKRKRKSTVIISSDDGTTIRKRRKKKKGRNSKETKSEDIEGSNDENPADVLRGELRHLEELKEKLGLTTFLQNVREKEANMLAKQEKKGQKVANKLKGTRALPEVIVFEDPAKRKRNKPPTPRPRFNSTGSDIDSKGDGTATDRLHKTKKNQPNDQELRDKFDMRSAKHDVKMFGITGLGKEHKAKAKLEVMMKLGAKAPKNPTINYKQFQMQRKKEKADSIEKRELDRVLGNKVSKSNQRKKTKRDKNDTGHVDGQVGRYVSGVQVLSGKDIRNVKRQPNKRGGGSWKHKR